MKENRLIKKDSDILEHLTIRLGIPLFVVFLLWGIGDISNGSFETLIFFSFFISVLLIIIITFLLRETIDLHRNKRFLLRNINCVLLMFFIPTFSFLVIVGFGLATF
ncbi:hypothetical protein OIU83_19100 [Flavobacterium sp. LS1R49]|uniref:Uncharacterized protein n=1 Tax=Flavobacterium shii TaxID=2987687 RepID=A0A9X2ZJD1_9FLAO|nr:hypothetical protein [Flavobacterium shii]MCV9929777.1 hypothetical protein [Flavobacterium shii]